MRNQDPPRLPSSLGLALPVGLALFLIPHTARGDGAPPLRVQLRAPAERAAAITAAIAAETDRPVQVVAAGAACEAPCLVVAIGDSADTADVRYIADGGDSRARAIALPADAGVAAETVGLLADNLVSDEAAALIAGLAPGDVRPVAPVETGTLLPATAPPVAVVAAPAPRIAATVAPPSAASVASPISSPITVREQRPRKYFAFGVVPLLSTDLHRVGQVEHEVSIDLLVGVSGGTTGLSAAGVLSVEHGLVDGAQVAGVASVADRVDGAQVAGVANLAAGPLDGFQLAGSFNVAGPVDGLQGAGAANLARGAVDGTQIAGALNIGGPVDGAQIAGAANAAYGAVDGAQLAGAANVAAGALDGAQVAGALNIAGGTVRGAQVAGALNIAGGTVRGAQIAPFNVARRIDGVQVGVVNVAASGDGTSIGLLTIVPGGRTDLEVAGDSGQVGTVLLRHGTRRWHNVYGFGGRPGDDDQVDSDDVWMYGLGMGPTWHPGRLVVDLDALCWQVNRGKQLADELSLLAQLRLSVGYPIGPVTVVGGVVGNTYISTEGGAHDVALRSKNLGVRTPDTMTGSSDDNPRVWIWPTAFVGLRI